MKEQHVIFDLDGTLIDSEEAVLKTWQQTLQAQVNRYFTLEALRAVSYTHLDVYKRQPLVRYVS